MGGAHTRRTAAAGAHPPGLGGFPYGAIRISARGPSAVNCTVGRMPTESGGPNAFVIGTG